MPIFRIDYGQHDGISFLHYHIYNSKGNIISDAIPLNTTNPLYKKYENIINHILPRR